MRFVVESTSSGSISCNAQDFLQSRLIDGQVSSLPLSDSLGISIYNCESYMRILESHNCRCWATCSKYQCQSKPLSSELANGRYPRSEGRIPTYPAPTQQMFFTPVPGCIAVSKDGLLVLSLLFPIDASSKASCSLRACKTGLKVMLPSGVVGAVDIRSSESTLEAAIEGCLLDSMIEIDSQSAKRQEYNQPDNLAPQRDVSLLSVIKSH